MAAKMATIVGDVTGLQQRHNSYNIPHLVEKDQRLSIKIKSFRNTVTDQNSGGSIHSPPPPPCIRMRYEFACTSEGETLNMNYNEKE